MEPYPYPSFSYRRRIDWQLEYDTAAIIRTDYVRRSLERHRRVEAGTHESVLSPEAFEREFAEASPTT